MLKINNNDINLTRGETVSLNFKIWNSDGTPFILPPVPNKLLLNIAKYNQLENHEFYEFYTPFKIISDTSSVVLDFATDSDGDYIDVFTIDKSYMHKYYRLLIKDKRATIQIDTNEMITGIRVYGCKLNEFSYLSGTAVHSFVTTEVLTSVLALTVRASNYDDIVMTKYLNLCGNTMQDGKTDYMPFGWNKFTTQDILESDSEINLEAAMIENYLNNGTLQVGKVDNNYYHLVVHKDGTCKLAGYAFDINIAILYEDTKDLEAKEYTYDLIAYQGTIKDVSVFDENVFPFKQISWKCELISPHDYTIGDSHNA